MIVMGVGEKRSRRKGNRINRKWIRVRCKMITVMCWSR